MPATGPRPSRIYWSPKGGSVSRWVSGWMLPAPCSVLRSNPVEVEWWGGVFASGRTPSESSIITRVRRAHETVSSHPQQTWGAPYGSDLRLMTELGGIPTVHYGPGDAALAHGPAEKVPINEVLTATRALALVALEHCSIA